MKFETVKIGDGVHVAIEGVTSAAFVRECAGGGWAVLVPQIAYTSDTLEDALAMIASDLGDWYTVAQAAEVLVEMGAFDAPPSTQMVCTWAREGKFPGAFKLTGPGGRGGGGSWRIPEAGLVEFAKRRGR